MPSSTAAMPDVNMNQRRTFGLLGEFPGDDELLGELAWCEQAFGRAADADAPKPPLALARLISLLGKLPLKGRQAVVRNILAKSPFRDAVLRDLFDYCLQAGDDDVDATEDVETKSDSEQDEDEFVVIAYPRETSTEEHSLQAQGSSAPKPLNLTKFHVFQTVLVLIAVSGKAGADASRRYLNETASTRYRAKVLIQAATCFSEAVFSNQELYNYYKDSPQSVQTNLVNACCQRRGNGKNSRVEFLRLVYESDGVKQKHPNLLYYLDSDYLAGQLDALMQHGDGEGTPKSAFVFQHWGRHGDVYMNYIRRRMQDCRHDQLQLGDFWHGVVEANRISKSMHQRHVYALLDLLQEYTVCRTKSSLSHGVLKYLQEHSAQGEDVSQFDGVYRVVMVSQDILEQLTQKERLVLAAKYMEARDNERFERIASLCSSHELAYQSYFASISLEEFWNFVSEKKADDFWALLSAAEMAKSIPVGPERSRYLQSWADLHNRCKPSDLTDEQISTWFQGRKTPESLWDMWFKSQAKFYDVTMSRRYDNAVAYALSGLSTECDELPDLSPKIKAYAKFITDVLNMASMAFDQVSSRLPSDVALAPLLGLLNKIYFSKLSKTAVESVRNLSESCIQVSITTLEVAISHFIAALKSLSHSSCCSWHTQILCDRVMPCLRDTMQFDLAQETYITEAELSFFERTIEATLQQWGLSDKVAASLALAVLDVHARVSSLPNEGEGNDFVVVTDPFLSKKCRFAYYKFHLHARVKSACYKLAKALLEVAAKVPSFDQSLSRQLWVLVRDMILADDSNLSAYLYACNVYLPTYLCDEERPSIIERSTEFILSTYDKSPNSWKTALASVAQELAKLGFLSTILDNEVIPPKITKYLQVEYGGFASEEARQSLKDETFAADADARATGLTVWLAKACETDSCSLMAEAMSFAASRVKNESGINRRTVFAWLESNFADKVVCKSLEDNSSAAENHEMLCSAILDMQKNDLSRLDCVGRQVCFPRLRTYILDTVLEFDPSRLCQERRQLWADCAVQMDWNLKAAMGDERLACYEWPIGQRSELQSASWISRDSFEAVYPVYSASTAGKITQLRKRVDLSKHLRENFEKENVFGPVQCVKMLESAIGKVWTDSLPSCALRLTGQFPEDKDVSNAWLERILVLYRLCGTSWQEVELLNSVFDSVIDALDDATAKEQDLLRANNLLETLSRIHKSSFWLVPKLAQACDKLFRCSFAAGRACFVKSWLPRWRMAYLESGRRVRYSPVDDRLQHFLDRYALGCEPDVWRPAMSKSDRVLKECRIARELLQMSPSSLLLADVRDVLFTRRQDVLLRYVRDPVSLYGVFSEEETDESASLRYVRDPVSLYGVFSEEGTDESASSEFSERSEPEHECESVDELLFQRLDEEALLSCHADVSIAYARFARTQASSSRLGLMSKIKAISKFMGAPSTQHDDVLAALQSNLDDAVRESLINRVFKLDSPWHILGYLLSQRAIEKNDQRITSSLLRYVAQHVHIDKVVSVAGLLLKNPRRRKLSFQLHKGVIRILFDAKTPEAMKLLGVEWMRDSVPDGVRSLIAEKCVQSDRIGRD